MRGVQLIESNREYDWLGPGAYFWESDPRRALEWATWKAEVRKDYEEPYVIGAIIDLRNCLDLVTREDLEVLRDAHRSYVRMQKKSGLRMPRNKRVPGQIDMDRSLRFLDCAVVRHLHKMLEDADVEPYDTVRGMFTEGGTIFKGSGFKARSHVQIAVRSPDCIKGLFVPTPYPTL